ncbi:RHS repeat domain-containing protein [[Flexibacter] sp. ATCC 35208]|uniref:RHS repeat domain-containing protein n=1 Tax=[Flexibacter] sp. ATCC 35208 TaxID=1936242 RepID=UPI0015C37D56|nr:RHS repeat-associated core domain-containing protein [[Flexibacter] sp. ATCC 35208]
MKVNVEDGNVLPGVNITGLGSGININFSRGEKFFELSNHLGNVLSTVSDRRVGISTDGTLVDHYEPTMSSSQEYYPFGMLMPGRQSGGVYRYGFNGQENDNEVKGEGNQVDFGERMYDSRIGRFLSIDPLVKQYPDNSPYLFALNSPLIYIDNQGEDARVSIIRNKDGSGVIKIQTVVHIDGRNLNRNANLPYYYNERGKESFKSGKYSDGNGKVWRIEFDVKYVYSGIQQFGKGDNYALVDNKNTNIDKDGRSITLGNTVYMNSRGQYADMTHETGHLLGLTDRYSSFYYMYSETGNERFTGFLPHDGFENNLMGGRGKELNQAQYDNWGSQLLEMAETNGDNFILSGKIEYRKVPGGLRLVPDSDVSDKRKEQYKADKKEYHLKQYAEKNKKNEG